MSEKRSLAETLMVIDPLGVIKEVDKLVVNTACSYRTAAKKSEEEGVKDIRELIDSSDLEELWAYLPQESLWVEIGRNEESFGESSVSTDEAYFKKLIQTYDELILYHFHINDERNYPSLKELKKIFNVKKAMPSGSDLAAIFCSSILFYRFQPYGKISAKLCSKCGITEFYLTDSWKEYYKNASTNEIWIMQQILRMLAEEILGLKRLYDLRLDEIATINKVINELGADNNIMGVSFTPYEKYN